MIIFEIPYEYRDRIQSIMRHFPKISRYHGSRPRNKVMRPCGMCEHVDPKKHPQDQMKAAWEWFKETNRLTAL